MNISKVVRYRKLVEEKKIKKPKLIRLDRVKE